MPTYVSDSRAVGVCVPDFLAAAVAAVLPSDFTPADASVWVHGEARRRLVGFDIDTRDRNCPGHALRLAGLSDEAVVAFCRDHEAAFWLDRYHTACAFYGFAPNLGGRADAPTLNGREMADRVARAVAGGVLPTEDEWMAVRPDGWLDAIVHGTTDTLRVAPAASG